MSLPKNNYKLDEIFKKAEAPAISEFNGEYFVDMLTGLPSLKKFSHRKVFYPKNNKIMGYNILLKNWKWGYFFLEEEICKIPYLDEHRRKEMNSLKINPVGKDETLNPTTAFSEKTNELYSSPAQAEGLFIGVIVINYDRRENSFLTNKIRDYVRRIDENLYLGRFNYFFRGKPRFLGYFSLTKSD